MRQSITNLIKSRLVLDPFWASGPKNFQIERGKGRCIRYRSVLRGCGIYCCTFLLILRRNSNDLPLSGCWEEKETIYKPRKCAITKCLAVRFFVKELSMLRVARKLGLVSGLELDSRYFMWVKWRSLFFQIPFYRNNVICELYLTIYHTLRIELIPRAYGD